MALDRVGERLDLHGIVNELVVDTAAQTGLILGLIFLQHHETRLTRDNTIP
jgi:hypothetical protein